MILLKIIEKYFISVLLIVVVLIQLYNSQFSRLTPWKGGGFGMFSTNKRANIVAIGYRSNNDSVIINVVDSKYGVPISRSFLTSARNFPKRKKLERLGLLIVNSYLTPKKLEIPKNIDSRSADLIDKNQKFYNTMYLPKYYQSDKNAKLEDAIKIEKVKIILYETDFFEEGLAFKKRLIDEIEIKKTDNNTE